MLPFAIRNSRWLLLAALCTGLGLYAGAQHIEVLNLKASIAIEQAAAEKAINDAKAADAIKTAKLEAAHATAVKVLQEKASAQQTSVARARRSITCIQTDAARAFLGGLPGDGKPDPRQPRSTAQPDAAVPR
jgi:hypothetical protein